MNPRREFAQAAELILMHIVENQPEQLTLGEDIDSEYCPISPGFCCFQMSKGEISVRLDLGRGKPDTKTCLPQAVVLPVKSFGYRLALAIVLTLNMPR